MTIEEAINTAIEYEARLRDIYLEAAAAEDDATGRQIFETLANDEQNHIDYLKDTLEQWKNTGKVRPVELESAIPPPELLDKQADKMETLVKKDFQGLKTQMLSKALEMEIKTSDFYRQLVDELPAEARSMFERFLEIENNHIKAIQFELDYITHTGYWFGFKEFGLEE